MYQGSVEGAKEYFDEMGYPCSANINPADHYMDVIGSIMTKGCGKIYHKDVCDVWSNHVKERQINAVTSEDFVNGNKVLANSGMKFSTELTSCPGNLFYCPAVASLGIFHFFGRHSYNLIP